MLGSWVNPGPDIAGQLGQPRSRYCWAVGSTRVQLLLGTWVDLGPDIAGQLGQPGSRYCWALGSTRVQILLGSWVNLDPDIAGHPGSTWIQLLLPLPSHFIHLNAHQFPSYSLSLDVYIHLPSAISFTYMHLNFHPILLAALTVNQVNLRPAPAANQVNLALALAMSDLSVTSFSLGLIPIKFISYKARIFSKQPVTKLTNKMGISNSQKASSSENNQSWNSIMEWVYAQWPL